MDIGEGEWDGGGVPSLSPSNRSPSNPLPGSGGCGDEWSSILNEMGRGLMTRGGGPPAPRPPHPTPRIAPVGLSHPPPYGAPTAHGVGDGMGRDSLFPAWRWVLEVGAAVSTPNPGDALGTPWGHPGRSHTGAEGWGAVGRQRQEVFLTQGRTLVGSGVGAELLWGAQGPP